MVSWFELFTHIWRVVCKRDGHKISSIHGHSDQSIVLARVNLVADSYCGGSKKYLVETTATETNRAGIDQRDHLLSIFIDVRRNHYHGWHKNTTIRQRVQWQVQMKTFSYQMWSQHNRWVGSASFHIHEHIPGVLITTRNRESSCSRPCWTIFHRGTDDGTEKLRGFYLFCTGNISVVHETIRFKHHATL